MQPSKAPTRLLILFTNTYWTTQPSNHQPGCLMPSTLLTIPTCTHTPRAGQSYPHTTPLAYHTNTHSRIRCNTHKHTYVVGTHMRRTHTSTHMQSETYAPKHIKSYPNTVTHIQTQLLTYKHKHNILYVCTYTLTCAHTTPLDTRVAHSHVNAQYMENPQMTYATPTTHNKCNAHTHTHIQPFPGTTLAHGPHPKHRHTYTPLHAPMTHPYLHTRAHTQTHTHTHVRTHTHTRTHAHTQVHNQCKHTYLCGGEMRQIPPTEDTYFAERALQLCERPPAAGVGLGG